MKMNYLGYIYDAHGAPLPTVLWSPRCAFKFLYPRFPVMFWESTKTINTLNLKLVGLSRQINGFLTHAPNPRFQVFFYKFILWLILFKIGCKRISVLTLKMKIILKTYSGILVVSQRCDRYKVVTVTLALKVATGSYRYQLLGRN